MVLGSHLDAHLRKRYFPEKSLRFMSGGIVIRNSARSLSRNGYRLSGEECIDILSPFEFVSMPAS
jgi:hypothetical protein